LFTSEENKVQFYFNTYNYAGEDIYNEVATDGSLSSFKLNFLNSVPLTMAASYAEVANVPIPSAIQKKINEIKIKMESKKIINLEDNKTPTKNKSTKSSSQQKLKKSLALRKGKGKKSATADAQEDSTDDERAAPSASSSQLRVNKPLGQEKGKEIVIADSEEDSSDNEGAALSGSLKRKASKPLALLTAKKVKETEEEADETSDIEEQEQEKESGSEGLFATEYPSMEQEERNSDEPLQEIQTQATFIGEAVHF
jgi:hypothetical protein